MGLPKGPQEKNLPAKPEGLSLFFLDFWIRIVKIICPRVGQGLYINLQKKPETNSK